MKKDSYTILSSSVPKTDVKSRRKTILTTVLIVFFLLVFPYLFRAFTFISTENNIDKNYPVIEVTKDTEFLAGKTYHLFTVQGDEIGGAYLENDGKIYWCNDYQSCGGENCWLNRACHFYDLETTETKNISFAQLNASIDENEYDRAEYGVFLKKDLQTDLTVESYKSGRRTTQRQTIKIYRNDTLIDKIERRNYKKITTFNVPGIGFGNFIARDDRVFWTEGHSTDQRASWETAKDDIYMRLYPPHNS